MRLYDALASALNTNVSPCDQLLQYYSEDNGTGADGCWLISTINVKNCSLYTS